MSCYHLSDEGRDAISGRLALFAAAFFCLRIKYQSYTCKGPRRRRRMDRYKPRSNKVDEIVKHVCVSHAIHSCVDCDTEEKDTREMVKARCDSRNHLTSGEGLN